MFPSSFINYFCSLPSADVTEISDDVSSSVERPIKRRKTVKPSETPSIHVATGSVTLARRCIDVAPTKYTVSRNDVGQYLGFCVRDNRLVIRSQPGSPVDSFSATISLRPEDVTANIKDFLDAGGSSKNQALPGALWAHASAIIERRKRFAEIKLFFEVHWNETSSPFDQLRTNRERLVSKRLIDSVFPAPGSTNAQQQRQLAWSPMDFYNATFVPPKDDKIPSSIEIPELEATLFPYQKRTLQWLLRREGVQWSETRKGVDTYAVEEANSQVDLFRKVKDAAGGEFYLSDIFQTVTRDVTPFRRAEMAVRGGILAEEMGLGKTLEILGLILLHPRPSPLVLTKAEIQANLVPTGATLIVTPESLRAQWISEIARHTPGLSVKFYQGCKKLTGGEEEKEINELTGYDIIVTTYSILTDELHFATTPPERSRRYERVYPRTKSPLVQISWWRVCLDEAQMIENGISQAAIVARVIPRINAWGITGTPVKDDVKDLSGLLLFLQYEPYCSSLPIWQALIRDHKPIFQQLFNSISLRHTKSIVRDELLLPPQKRFVISMPFTAVEEQHYQSLYRDMAEACELSIDGAPMVEDWKPEEHEEDMRTWLNRLRQTALHPEVAGYNRKTLGNGKARPMRTVDEVLDAMLEQSENTIRADERAYLSSKLTRGQMYENSPRVKEALEIWKVVSDETARLVSDARAELKSLIEEQGGSDMAEKSKPNDSADPEDSEDEPGEGDNKGRLGESRRRLRGALEMQHKAIFFCANAYFQIRDRPDMTEPDSEDFHRLKKLEDGGYEDAKVIRREILHESHRKATRLMDKISQKVSEQTFIEIPELMAGLERGIESGRIVDDLDALYGELNDQASLIDDWREHVIQILLKPLVDEEDEVETTGEELGESAKIQDELMVYVQALRAVIADRQDAMSGQTNELIKHETATSLRLARNEDGPAPAKLIELMELRAQLKPRSPSMRAAISEFRGLISRLARDSNRGVIEGEIVDKQLKAAQALLSKQSKAAVALEAEVESFRTAMNARLEYYRQLQAVSDSVEPYEGPRTEATIQKLQETEESLRKKLSSAEAKHRYLLHLKQAGSKSNEPRMCVICQTTFTTGVLTVCGHQFCKECMMLWFNAHHNCPVCKKKLKTSNLHDITINPQQLKVHNETSGDEGSNSTENSPQKRNSLAKKTMIYSEFNSEKLAEIQNITLDGPSFTTKVDTLVKHLIWLRESDPGAKSIVFSQYKGFLNILRNAFSRFRIGHASIDDPSGITRFKEDPSVECFLLHARAHSSGLNLVNASHVFLCEPLLNTALELQAIARVDRIGQQHETTVWLYIVSGTIEESIYNLSVQRRMEHMGRSTKGKSLESTPELLDANIEAANTLELEQAALSRLMSKDKTAGEMVDRGDLWECLFGHIARRENAPERDTRLQEQAVMGYLAAEAAEERRGGKST
ncbi:SNF2 family N-terminal domain-containing protein [Ilyonectria robusta]|uniref:SNF2 family N-terminal domain-containing protein n=1 Tax=Ilyonectria robusta TaxID=1079257 RepID=UPI001E8EE980|nr:SNF2 family N-terminal domain-containing protein [Ilyonectria robusta]KAH8733310.1 SNF2 family N-terminal domain-containing protein [Ilyonectria robusta]